MSPVLPAISRRPLELVAPARDLEHGIEAINHGADSVYIGGPRFGARSAAGNSMADIARLVAHAHRYSAHVLLTLNTILRDEELELARKLAWEAFDAGVDALIVQDMGLLEIDLPSIALHASTQTDNRTAEKVGFLEGAGFSQIVLARELSLDAVRDIARQTAVRLEFFVHGALCVSYSGRCAISHALTGRSANRGECAQLCRLPYTLADHDGRIVARDQHLLSLKDNDQSTNLRALVEAGISAFKIEGRLKDMNYVKNVTAHYRRLIDDLLAQMPDYGRASSGRCHFSFEPAPEKTFNRGGTDYFVHGRQAAITEFRTPKFAGEPIGEVTLMGRDHIEIESAAALHNGDGLTYFDPAGELRGMRINRVEGRRLFPAERPVGLAVGTRLRRNHDQAFIKGLAHKTVERRIPVDMVLSETAEGFLLTLRDEDGTAVSAALPMVLQEARDSGQTEPLLREQLGKLGGTIFIARSIELQFSRRRFIPVAKLNGLRREAVAALEAQRLASYRRPTRQRESVPPPSYPATALTALDNVFNQKARDFYLRHGVSTIAAAYECNREKNAVALMQTRHCLRYSFNLCPRQNRGVRPEPMTLIAEGNSLTLRFDCKRCEMQVIGKLGGHRDDDPAEDPAAGA